ncbi:hypothetical protein F2P81_011399 [Scophthalmus maximus]|uniref:Ninjurin-1-like n=1 Tax=Scophthalmus maximus TaxID=52904 RepID=A0A6A4SRQ4_SCOMX|nr:hypothetical protein F2P81_011399 [Scophthalmus maximus]
MMNSSSSSNRRSGTEGPHPDAGPSIPAPLNMNHYANKKSAAESMLDVALLMANASQLKAVLEQGPHLSFYAPIVTLISISLCLQVTVGVLLIFIDDICSDPVGFFVTEYLGVDPVELQHQSVNEFNVHPLI